MPKKPLTISPAYESFIRHRDLALEVILFKYQIALTQIVSVLRTRTEEIAAHLSTKHFGKEYARMNREMFQKRLEPWFQMGIHQAISLIQNMRSSIYVLSYAGQAEAIGRALDRETKASLSRSDLEEERNRATQLGGRVSARIELYFHRLLRDIVDAFQASQVLESPVQETLERIQRAFPRTKRIPKRPKMAKIQEADRSLGKGVSLSSGVIDPQAWEQMLMDYRDEYLPFGRSPEDKVFYAMDFANDLEADSIEGYQWELEQEVTNDFIQSVRNGEIEAANENGISDFQWIAVIDGKTDECCSVRDGLSSAEISQKLDAGEDMGDCDAETPPAHMNCRCRAAPMTEEMTEKEKPEVDYAGFDSWLEDRGL